MRRSIVALQAFGLLLAFSLLDTSGALAQRGDVAGSRDYPGSKEVARDAEARGCTVLDGLGMLVNQGVIGIRHWTGIDPDPDVMRRKLEELFGS